MIRHAVWIFDRTSGQLAGEFPLPDDLLPTIKEIVGVGADDPDAVFSYSLDQHLIEILALLAERYTYTLEPT